MKWPPWSRVSSRSDCAEWQLPFECRQWNDPPPGHHWPGSRGRGGAGFIHRSRSCRGRGSLFRALPSVLSLKWPPWPGSCYELPSVLSLWNDLRDPGHIMSCRQFLAYDMTSVTRVISRSGAAREGWLRFIFCLHMLLGQFLSICKPKYRILKQYFKKLPVKPFTFYMFQNQQKVFIIK